MIGANSPPLLCTAVRQRGMACRVEGKRDVSQMAENLAGQEIKGSAYKSRDQGQVRVFWRRFKKSLGWYPFILYNLFIFILFNLLAWIYLVRTSLYRAQILMPAKFIGLDNFTRMFTDGNLHNSLLNTFEYWALAVPAGAIISLFVAMAVNKNIIGSHFFRSMYFLPVVTAAPVLAMIWARLFTYRPEGPMNYLLGLVGIPPQEFLVNVHQAMPVVAAMSIWAGFGYTMIIWLSGLQSVPRELYEAARVDGARRWQLHWHITLPLLRPTAAFILITATIGALQVFSEIYVMTGGGPAGSTSTIVWFLYSQSFQFGRLGYGSAISILIFAIILIITLIQMRVLRVSERIY